MPEDSTAAVQDTEAGQRRAAAAAGREPGSLRGRAAAACRRPW